MLRGTFFALLTIASIQSLAAQDKLLPVFQFNRLTTSDGLPTNEIRSNVVRDARGFIWIGTKDGLVRYDGNSCKVYRNDPGDVWSISSWHVMALLVDRRDLLWYGTLNTGLGFYDAASNRFFNLLPRQRDSSRLHTNSFDYFHEDQSGNIWCGSMEGEVVLMDFTGVPDGTSRDTIPGRIRFRTFQGFGNTIWDIRDWDNHTVIVAADSGLFLIDRTTGTKMRPGLPATSGIVLDTARVSCLCWETPQKLWLGTYSQGLYLYDRAKGSIAAFHKRRGRFGKQQDDPITYALFDNNGRFWLGTTSGLDLFDTSSGSYQEYLTPSVVPFGEVWFLSADNQGVLWITSYTNGLFFLSTRSFQFPHFGFKASGRIPAAMESVHQGKDGSLWIRVQGKAIQVQPDNMQVLQTISLYGGEKSRDSGWRGRYVDEMGRIWYPTSGMGICRFEPTTGMARNFHPSKHIPALPFKNDVCLSITGGRSDSLWVAGYKDGLFQYHPRSNTFTDRSTMFGPRLDHVGTVFNDDSNNLWVTDQIRGLFRFNQITMRTDHFEYDQGRSNSLSDNEVEAVYQDPRGRIWIGASTLNLWDRETNTFSHFPNTGIRNAQYALPLRADSSGNLWVSYAGRGLGILNPTTGTFANYDFTDGLAGTSDMAQLLDGRVVLVGDGGINFVDPGSLSRPHTPPPLVITRVSINDAPDVSAQSLSAASGLHLTHDQNVLEFEFAAIDPGATHLIDYSYRLEGVEKDWVVLDGRRYVRYSGLNPGDYIFRVKAMNRFGRWPDQQITLSVSIAPPWWRTLWATVAYAFLAVAFLFGVYRLRLRQIHRKQEAEMEHFQLEHLTEMDRLKSRFFSNISHELRTPLTLILGPAERGMESSGEQVSRDRFHLIRDNARKLENLVSQLLDFSRLESGMIRLRVSYGDVVPFLRRVTMSFESWAERKKIELTFNAGAGSLEGFFDKDKLEKIVNNLMSNALKFTPEGGTVTVRVTDISSRNSIPQSGTGEAHEGGFCRVFVGDTGTGISAEHLPKIFDRFYRVDDTNITEGTGIGLALTKELVELHHGTITVESTPGKGSAFTVTIPIQRSAFAPDEIDQSPAPNALSDERVREPSVETTGPGAPVPAPAGKPIVLLVEDNADLRAYIREYLDVDFAVLEAENGKAGYDRAVETVPDIIISDVMMPEMDGMELCRALKQDARASHVPVILLTARASTDSKIEGLETGADDYVTKPFDSKELVARVRNLIEQRQQLRKKFSAGVVLKPGEVTVSSVDDSLLKKIMQAVEDEIGNEDFGVDDLARVACLSRAHLNRKLQALTNLSPGEFIRYMRLQRARELLEKGAGTVAEIAYRVGFSNPSHFSASFRERFGVLPSGIRGAQPQ
jgi:signal transduction histidine kinase/ligand-binding sensor domain-containing protein/AraC-like DNA-binding protein